MKIQFLNGGLANQVFQYMFARYYELAYPGETMLLDDTYFALHTVHNGYELEKVFGIRPHLLSGYFDEESWTFILQERRAGKSVPQILNESGFDMPMITEVENYKQFNPFNGTVMPIPANGYFPEILEYPGDVYFHGYWINKGWFDKYRDVFLKELALKEPADEKNRTYLEQIKNTQSVSIHIRRGDYVKLGWAYSAEVYRQLVTGFLEKASGKWNLFVFSDDISWCREYQKEMGFELFAHTAFIEGNDHGKNYIDLMLMSQCKGMIMSNSSFCYLAALLNTEKQFVLNMTKREV